MDLPANQFKRALARRRARFSAPGSISGAPSTAEALGCAGFDFLVVDMEHTPIDTAADDRTCCAPSPARPRGGGAHAWNDMVHDQAALDVGAQSLLIPFVQNAEEAKRAVSYTRYPPDGVRGVAGDPPRQAATGTVPNYFEDRRRGDLRDRADRDDRRARTLDGDRSGSRHRFPVHRSRGPRGVDGSSRRHQPSRRAGEDQARRRAARARQASPSASSAPSRSWSPSYRRVRASPGSRSAPTSA